MLSPQWMRRFPWLLVAAVLFLVAAGWAGMARCEALGAGQRLMARQAVWTFMAAAAACAAALIPYRVLGRWSYGLLTAAICLLLLVYLFPPINGARRWIRVGSVGFQPSELTKLAYVLGLAWYLRYRETHRRLIGLLGPLVLTLVPVVLILREPDLGTAAVFLPVLFVMLFAAGARRRDLAKLVAAGLVSLPLLWTQMTAEQRSRVTALWDQAGPGEVATDAAYHLRQAKQVLALGGLWGSAVTGAVVQDPAAYHLPAAHSDFVLCVLGERFGLIGVGVLLALYGVVSWQGLAVAQAAREPFGRLLATGLIAVIAVQVLINAAMTVGLMPITGLSLPLVSYGGSGLVVQGIGVGLLVNIALRPGYELGRDPFCYATAQGSKVRRPAR
ncbi:MAG TPA: rod shape-determining protein RodA [Planctomycetes bacterium]|nr:rod shape-determining protein RodA [Planctomycetota bacterium]